MNIKLTTDHPASSHGVPVAIIDGQAYGPDDVYEGIPVSSYIIVNISGDHPDLENMLSFLKPSPAAHKRGFDALKRWKNAPVEK